MINQENHRKSGYAIEPEEEQLRYLAYVCGVFFYWGGGVGGGRGGLVLF